MGRLSHVVKAIDAAKKAKLEMQLKEYAAKANLDPEKITTDASGIIRYPEEYINPLSDVGAGGVRREVAVHNDAVLGSDTKGEFNPDTLYHGSEKNIPNTGFRIGIPSKRAMMLSDYDVESSGNFFVNNKEDAFEYGRNVSPYQLKQGRKLTSNAPKDELKYIFEPMIYDNKWVDVDNGISRIEADENGEWVYYIIDRDLIDWGALDNKEVVNRMKSLGYDSVDVYEPNQSVKKSTFIIPTQNIRSPNAAFDPQFKDSSNLLGQATTKQLAGASTVGAAGLGLQAFIDKRKQRANSLVNRAANKVGYFAEPIATMATGYASDLASGLVGAASLPFVGSEQAAKNIEAVQNTFGAWKPRTHGGNQAFEDLGGLIDQGAHMYNFTAKKTGFDPMANFNESAEGLHKAGLDAPAAILTGLPGIL